MCVPANDNEFIVAERVSLSYYWLSTHEHVWRGEFHQLASWQIFAPEIANWLPAALCCLFHLWALWAFGILRHPAPINRLLSPSAQFDTRFVWFWAWNRAADGAKVALLWLIAERSRVLFQRGDIETWYNCQLSLNFVSVRCEWLLLYITNFRSYVGRWKLMASPESPVWAWNRTKWHKPFKCGLLAINFPRGQTYHQSRQID